MPGGAGFGPVAERPVAKILDDLDRGVITPRGAVDDYGLDPTDLPAQPSAPASKEESL